MKFGHVGFGVKDLDKSKEFYRRVFETIELPLIDENEQSMRFGLDGRTMFYIHTRELAPGPFHIAFDVESRAMVDAFYTAALQSGGTDNGVPGVREHYSSTYYAAFVLDPNGNNIEVVCRG
jgi:catechol 2,3-dioxygenase-like lactoylglutathione lyase family enzyme